MGKTSFLLQLPALLPGDVIPAFIDLQRPALTANAGAFFYAIAQAVQRDAQPYRLQLPVPERAAFQSGPFEAFDAWLEAALPLLQPFTVLLVFDEFENAGRALGDGRLPPAAFDQLRHLIQHCPQMALLFAGVQTLDELGPQWSSYFTNVRPLSMGYLEPAEAEELVRRPDAEIEFPLEYGQEAVQRLLAHTGGHPYLVQLVCSCVVELCNQRQTLLADLPLVEAAETLALERGEPYFRNVWDEMAGPDGQGFLRQAAGAAAPVPLGASTPEERRTLERLVRLKVLAALPAGYAVELPLIRRWVNERAPA